MVVWTNAWRNVSTLPRRCQKLGVVQKFIVAAGSVPRMEVSVGRLEVRLRLPSGDIWFNVSRM